MACVFCEIVAGAIAAQIVFEDEISVAFLDSRPLFPGHCLLVPREHVETFADLPGALIGPFFGNAQRLSGAVERGMEAEGTFVAMNNRVSQSVAHLHVHIVPRWNGDTNFMPILSGTRMLAEGLRALYDKLIEAQSKIDTEFRRST